MTFFTQNAQFSHIAEHLMWPNPLTVHLEQDLAWRRWEVRGWLRRRWDALLRREAPPRPPAWRFTGADSAAAIMIGERDRKC